MQSNVNERKLMRIRDTLWGNWKEVNEIDKKLNIVIQKHTNVFEKKIKEMNLEFDKRIEKMNFDLEHRKSEITNNLGEFSFEISNLIYNKILDENKKINISEFNKLNSGGLKRWTFWIMRHYGLVYHS